MTALLNDVEQDADRTCAGPLLARLNACFDDGTIQPLRPGEGVGVAVAAGLIGGVRTIAFANDPARCGGALGVVECERVVAAIDQAIAERVPVLGLWHSGGARLDEGVASLQAVGAVFEAMTRASGVVPQISVVLGPAAGGAAYGPALTDVVIMSRASRIFVTGPRVVELVTGARVDMEVLGGAAVHAESSGLAHVVADDDEEALAVARSVIALLGRSPRPCHRPVVADPSAVLPVGPRRAYDVRPLIARILDSPPVELQPGWAPSIVTSLGRLHGTAVGIVANNPIRLAGCLTAAAGDKAARFVRMCDGLGLPLVVVVDVPGYLPGVAQERDGVVRRGAKLLHAFADAKVPRVTLITRKAYGGAFIAMNSRSLGATAVLAWPTAEVAVMHAETAVRVLRRKNIAAAAADDRPALLAALVADQERTAGGLDRALEIGAVDAVIDPRTTRDRIAEIIARAPAARGRHRNIPL